MQTSQGRGVWGSRMGFVLAAAGSAIGLGNIWRFPYATGQNGGAAFVLLYILFVILIGAPVMIAELAIGRNTQLNPVGAFRKLAPGSLWTVVGMLGVATGVGILSYYSVIAGWTVGYFVKTISGEFSTIIAKDISQQIFENFVGNPYSAVGYLFVFIIFTAYVVVGGVSRGIERWTKILMPILFILLILLTIRSVTLNNAAEGLVFYLKPDFTKITAGTVGNALGQALFSLSLGMGAMITYGSYISKRDNLTISAGYVCLFDTLIAIIAGLMIFPALSFVGLKPEESGPGLVFVLLPSIFAEMPGGFIFGAGFFLLLSVAALTSTISLMEVTVSYMVDEWKWKRVNAVIVMSILAFLLGIPSALSTGASGWFTDLPLLHMGFLDLANALLGNYSLTIGAFLISIFVAYKWGLKSVFKEIELNQNIFYFNKFWAFMVRFICPVAIFIIFVYIVITGEYF